MIDVKKTIKYELPGMFLIKSIPPIFSKASLFTLLFLTSFYCFSQPRVSLVFHAGLGANGVYQIGGTLQNNSDEEIPHSAITYIVIDAMCKPADARVANLGSIKPHGTLEFRIPIEGTLSAYRILNISSWNGIGIPVETEDKTAELIRQRDADVEKRCLHS